MQQYTKPFRLLMNDNPFFGLYLLGVNKYEIDHSIPVAAVAMEGYNFKLLLRKGAYLGLPEAQQIGVLKHEILHILLGHLGPYYRNRCPDHKIFNIAADLEINQYIPRDELPEDALFLDKFPEYEFPEKAGTVFYYDFLKQKIEDLKEQYPDEFYGDPCPGDGSSQGPTDPSDQSSNSNDPQEGSSSDPSDSKDGQSQDEPKTGSGKGPSQADETLIDLYGKGDPSHREWQNPDLEPGESETGYWEAVDEIRRQQLRRAYTEIQRNTGGKGRGYLPGNLLETIDKLMEKKDPVVDWRSYFRRFVAASQNVVVKKTKRKESNRFIGMPGMKFNPRHDILVAVDTSGSVSTDELANFYTELNFIHKAGVKITVAQCDAGISDIQKFSPSNQVKIHGRGGTDFDPPLEYLNKNKSKYTCLVYFTDGACTPPSVKTNKPILWVITRGERHEYKEQKFPGDIVIMKNIAT